MEGYSPNTHAAYAYIQTPGANATVTATASGRDNVTGQNVTETKTGITGSGGNVRFTTTVDTGSLCVGNVTHATLTYDSGQNVITCVGW
jgi:hypothetical protein